MAFKKSIFLNTVTCAKMHVIMFINQDFYTRFMFKIKIKNIKNTVIMDILRKIIFLDESFRVKNENKLEFSS